MKNKNTPYLNKFASMQKYAGPYSKLVKTLIKAKDTSGISKGVLKGILENNPQFRNIDGIILDPKAAYPHVAKGLNNYTNRLLGYYNKAQNRYEEIWDLARAASYRGKPEAQSQLAYYRAHGTPFERWVAKTVDPKKFTTLSSHVPAKINSIHNINRLTSDHPEYRSSWLPFIDKLIDAKKYEEYSPFWIR